MPAPVGTQIRLISWGIPGIEGVSLNKVVIQKATSFDGPFFDLPATPINILDADGNFIQAFQDNQSDDGFFYRIAFKDSQDRQSYFTVPETPALLDTRTSLLDRLRMRLGDDDPSRYQLDNNVMFKWDRLKISAFLDEGMLEFNAAKPTQFNFLLETSPADVLNIVLTFAQSKCLRERATLELANKMSYNDGISLTIDRASEYNRMAEKMWDQALAQTEAWKQINRARARGLAYQRLPFKVLRPLSFGPNAVNLFST